jgi:plastocyanin
MKKRFISIFLMLFFALAITSCSSSQTGTTTPATNQTSSGGTGDQKPAVTIENYSFSPAVLTVKVGTTVVWTNNDTAVHNIKSTEFNSKGLAKGDTFEFKFEKAGTYDYICGVHPTMKGRIIVK